MISKRQLAAKGDKEGEVERTYRTLKKWILECRFRPGELLAEVDLARLCQTSRTPVREACNRLSQENWIARIPHKGYLVPAISVREIVEVYEYRKLLECFTAERAAASASADQISRLKELLKKESEPGTATNELLSISESFHLAVAEIARNQRILRQLKATLEYVYRLDLLSTETEVETVPHAGILRAIELKKPAKAKEEMAAHIDQSRDRMLRIFGA
jgi:DNA-binding GntR family transcriptional regulator